MKALRIALLSIGLAVGTAGFDTKSLAGALTASQKFDLSRAAAGADKQFADQQPAVSEAPSAEQEAAYRAWKGEFERRSWEWHLLSTKIIFFVVLIVVGFGLVVSWLQFRSDIRPKMSSTSAGTTEDAGGAAATYDVSASLQSVSVKSKTIGAVVLIFSGVFFFLYLSIVYPMTSVAEGSSHSSEKAAQ